MFRPLIAAARSIAALRADVKDLPCAVSLLSRPGLWPFGTLVISSTIRAPAVADVTNATRYIWRSKLDCGSVCRIALNSRSDGARLRSSVRGHSVRDQHHANRLPHLANALDCMVGDLFMPPGSPLRRQRRAPLMTSTI